MPDPLGDFSHTWPFYAGFLIAYLAGTIPFGLLLARGAGHGDIRRIGSGNIGATNVLRTGGKGLAALTLLLDAGKGGAAVLIADRFGPDMAAIAAAGAVLGHIFPVWLRFRGGKGVATTLGALLALAPPVGAVMIGVWLAAALLFRYSSLAAICAMIAAPLASWWLADAQRFEVSLVLAALVLLRHIGNFRRLVAGAEPRIGRKG